MTVIDKIVVDLDDTLNSLTMHLLRLTGADCGSFDYHKFPHEVGYDMVAAWAEMTGNDPIPVPEWWEMITRDMWSCAPKSDQFWLLDRCAGLVGQENVLMATVPTKCGECLAGKYDWMEKHLPDWMQRQYAVIPRKHWLSQPGVLLIDDSGANCEKWEDPGGFQEGGDTIIVPRPWNWARHHDTDEYIEYQLRCFNYTNE